jgi:hypothetical protein
MFRSRWTAAWLGIWFVGATVWALMLLGLIVARWPNLPAGYRSGRLLELPLFFLTYFTLPALIALLGGLVLGWLVIFLARLPIWTVWIDSGALVRAFWRRLRT